MDEEVARAEELVPEAHYPCIMKRRVLRGDRHDGDQGAVLELLFGVVDLINE
jgi:hypothetical protein